MIRFLPLIGLAATALVSAPAAAADYNWADDCCGDFRGAYPEQFEDELDIELGVRYWYSMGAHRMTVGGGNYTSDDTSHILEGHLRIDDNTTDFYVKGNIGYSAVINTTYSGPMTPATASQSGRIFYGGGDVGWLGVGSEAFRAGAFAGYQYWEDSPDMGRVNYSTGSQPNSLIYNVIRLGVAAKADFDMFDISAEVAAIPYANLTGTYGALNPPLNPGETLTSTGSISGWLYGAGGEVMARFHPTENWTIGLGGRAWYLTGQADVRFTTDQGNWVTKTTNYSTMRYGLLGEVSYSF